MYLFLVNSYACNNRYKYIEKYLNRFLEKNKIKHKIVIIEDLADIARLLKEHVKENTKAIIAVGGNGTVTSVIDAMVDYELPLGIIPTSQSNQLANMLGINNWKKGIKLLNKPNIATKKLGKIGKHYFVGSLTIAPKKNIIPRILNKQRWLKSFLGTNLNKNFKELHNVATIIKIDNNLEIQCQINYIELNIEEENNKQIKIIIHRLDKNKECISIFRGNKIEISSSLSLPILSGNETLANTPAIISAAGKSIKIIQAPKKLKDKT